MTTAYDPVYLEKARTALGRMLDFAVYDLHQNLTSFFDMFASSRVGKMFETGDFTVTVGKSGIELAYLVLEVNGAPSRRVAPLFTPNRSPEYWAGWALAYYQWKTAMSYEEIIKFVSIEEVVSLYSPYHEMDILQFCDKMDALYRASYPETNLKRLRKSAGLSQGQLALLSDVPMRTIQQYEQRQKSINKAQFVQVVKLAKALCCNAEDLLEKIE